MNQDRVWARVDQILQYIQHPPSRPAYTGTKDQVIGFLRRAARIQGGVSAIDRILFHDITQEEAQQMLGTLMRLTEREVQNGIGLRPDSPTSAYVADANMEAALKRHV